MPMHQRFGQPREPESSVGFGITTPAQVRQISRNADGVIIGSALVNAIEKSKDTRFQGAARFIRSLKGALHAS